MNILYKDPFDHKKMSDKVLKPCMTPMCGFIGEEKISLGLIDLTFEIRSSPHTAMRVQTFFVLDGLSSYNTFYADLLSQVFRSWKLLGASL